MKQINSQPLDDIYHISYNELDSLLNSNMYNKLLMVLWGELGAEMWELRRNLILNIQ